MSSTKRKQEETKGSSEPDTRSLLSPILRAPQREARTRSTGAGSNCYFRDNCISLFHQNMERLNEEFASFVQANPGIDYFWQVCEYIRQAQQLKELYQKVFPGMVMTCGSNEMSALGYEYYNSVTRPKRVRALTLGMVQIACGSCHTVTRDANGRVYAFGSSDEGAMGRLGEDYTGDLRVTGFIPSKHASFPTPIDKEDSCIVKIRCGELNTLFLTIHGNLYEAGCFRDYGDKKLRVPKPPDDTSVEEKKFPYGFHQKPVHLYEIQGKVVDMDCGTYMNAAILEDGKLVTWGVGTMGELGRPVAGKFMEKETDVDGGDLLVYDEELLGRQFLRPLTVAIPAQFSKQMVAISVACGSGHLVVVAREAGSIDSTVYASGFNKSGQLGLGDTTDRKLLTPLSYTRDENWMIAQVVCGSFYTLALDLSKTRLYGCGQCDNGQLGHTDTDFGLDTSKWFVTKLQPVPFPENDLEIDEIACGDNHNLAIVKPSTGRREVYTWGFGDPSGALGHGTETIEFRPKKLAFPMKGGQEVDGVWRGVSGGAQHSAFLFSPKE